MPIEVHVKKVNVALNQMILDFGNTKLDNVVTNTKNNNEKIVIAKEKKNLVKPAKPFKIYTAKVVGNWIYGGTSSETSAELLLNGGTIGFFFAKIIFFIKIVFKVDCMFLN